MKALGGFEDARGRRHEVYLMRRGKGRVVVDRLRVRRRDGAPAAVALCVGHFVAGEGMDQVRALVGGTDGYIARAGKAAGPLCRPLVREDLKSEGGDRDEGT